VKERPILFSGPMVRAILEGRKTQTRRVASHPLAKSARVILGPNREWYFDCIQHDETGGGIQCPYGSPGDRLWVRETWGAMIKYPMRGDALFYRASDPSPDKPFPYPWRPSIHMPRWASRITLEIEAVLVERLQDISEEDAKAEGIESRLDGPDTEYCSGCNYDWCWCPVTAYKRLWESINGPGSWDANPWVWVIQFRRVQ